MGSRKKTKRAGRRSRPVLSSLVVLLAVAIVVFGIWLLGRESVQPAEEGDQAASLEAAIILGARELGIPATRVRLIRDGDAAPLYQFRCPDRLHPLNANRWLSRIFAAENVRIVDCLEAGNRHRPSLMLTLEAGKPPVGARLRVLPPIGAPPLRERSPRLAVVIDDFGHNYNSLARGFLDLEMDFTVSILPGLRRSARVEREARSRGRSVFLHVPMEPVDSSGNDPGRGAIWADMTPAAIRQLLDSHLSAFDRIDGFNNHMGSRVCQMDEVLDPILGWAKDNDLAVLDSRTHPKSRIRHLAEGRGLPAISADIFLDGEEETEAQIRENIAVAVELARRRGWAVVIGHPHAETLTALRKMAPRLQDYGVRFLTLPALLDEIRAENPVSASP